MDQYGLSVYSSKVGHIAELRVDKAEVTKSIELAVKGMYFCYSESI